MKRTIGILAVLVALAASGCSAASGYCSKEAECVGGNDADQDACMARLAGGEAEADAYECGEPWSKHFECVAEKASCITDTQGDKLYTSIDGATGEDNCGDERRALETCVEAASGLYNT